MALVTLTGTISGADLTNNFDDKVTNLKNQAEDTPTFHQVDVECTDLTSATTNGLNVEEFEAPDDLELWAIGLSMWNPDVVSRTITLTLTAIDSEGNTVSKYLLDQTVSVNVTGATAAEHNATRTGYTSSTGTKIFLVKGITYRLTLTSSVASAVDRAYGFILCRQRRRRA